MKCDTPMTFEEAKKRLGIVDRKPLPMTNEQWLRSATFEELAGAIYEWHTKGYARGRLEVDLNPITEVVEWLKQPHTTIKE